MHEAGATPTPRRVLPYRSWNRIRNMGDAITPYIIESLFDFLPLYESKECPHLLGTGSIYFIGNNNSHFWGAGIQDPKNVKLPDINVEHIHAARGKLTIELLKSKGLNPRDVPLGDPGIFAKELLEFYGYGPSKRSYRAAIVPHHSSVAHPAFQRFVGSDEFCIINVFDTSLDCIRQIWASEVVISQSLHGLIFAESLGKPSVWIGHSDDDGWGFKFRDWHSTLKNGQTRPSPIVAALESLIERAEPRCSTIDKSALVSAFPRHLAQERAIEPFDFKACRSFDPVFVRARLFDTGGAAADWQQLERSALDGLRRRVASVRGDVLLNWSEKPYLCIACNQSSLSISRTALVALAQYLDEHPGIEFASVISRKAAAAFGVEVNEVGSGLGLVSSRRLIGGALLLRPTTHWLPDLFSTFVI